MVAWCARLGRRSIRRTPTIRQMETVECGAAALAMILAHYGSWIPLEQLRVACGVSRDGINARNVLAAARHYGLSARAFKMEPAELSRLAMPCVIHWNFNHFVVLEGVDHRYAHVNDPAAGRRRISLAELDAAFTGVVLTMTPAAEYKRVGSKPQVFHQLGRELVRSKAAVALLMVVSAAMVVPGILLPALAQVFVDNILVERIEGWFVPLLIGIAVAGAGRVIITALQQSLLLRLETRFEVTMISRFLSHLLSLPIEFFTQRHPGDVVSRVSSNEQIARALSGGLATNTLDLVSLVFFATAMAIYDVELAAVGISVTLLNVVVLRLVAGRQEELSRGLAVEQGKVNGSVVGIIRTIETLKAGGLEDGAFARWAGFHAKALNAQHALGIYAIVLETCTAFFSVLSTVTVLGLGGLRVMDGAMTVGALVAFQSLLASFDRPIASLVQLAGSFQRLKGDLLRLQDVFNYPIEKSQLTRMWPDGAHGRLEGGIELENVRFGYSPLEPPFIDGLSMKLQPGTRIALVGVTGCGKSTVGRLICGLLRPWAGEIRFDGVPLSEIPPEVFATSVGYVDQDVFLFEGTVRDNLTLWDPTVPEADVVQALRDAMVLDEVASRPGGFDCQVAEGGVNFSGGQQERIEIARALVGNRSVLILDEATANLDPVTEKAIYDNLRRRGCTSIVIAHRLSAIRDCDEIIVLDQGKVVERGTHGALLAMGGVYAELMA
jgi:NHLM bacteriocin system ABC transporter peptidase/ATP-binding protein